jgi:2-phosphosulfolactate phosphatase
VTARQIGRWELDGAQGAVVVVDVLRAFTTAAYAFDAGAEAIYLVADVDEALAFKARHPLSLAVGEDRGLMPDGFDLPNSPAAARRADLAGRTIVQRTSAGTQGVVAAVHAERTLALGPEHCDPADIDLAGRVDAFDFALEVVGDEHGLRLHPRAPIC